MIGKVFAKRYKVIKEIGQGGMSVVYLAEDILLGRDVAIKILREQYIDDEKNIRFFQNEARSIAALSHPNIVKIFDIGKESFYYFIVMEYLEGKTLKEIISQEAPMDYVRAINIMRYVLRALEHSHRKGIIHRDIKPHNIILTNEDKVKVTDFGIARNMASASVTCAGEMVGSVYYISPEQATGNQTTYATDIYSSGVMFYEMLCGKVPFIGDNPVGIALSHVEKNYQPLSYWNKKIPGCLEEVVDTAMEKDPRDRYDSAIEMARDLSRAKMLIVKGKAKPKNKTIKIKPKYMWLGALALLLIAIPLSWYVWENSRYVDLHDVVGLSLDEGEMLLVDQGFSVNIIKEEIKEELAHHTIIDQNPNAESRIKRGRTIGLTISIEPEPFDVPDVVGMSERAAIIRLENNKLIVEKSYEIAKDLTIERGTVLKQYPAYPSQVTPKTTVLITINQGSKAKSIKLKDMRGMTLQEAESYLRSNELLISHIDYDTSDIYFLGEVLAQSIEPGTTVHTDQRISLIISKGPGMSVREKAISFTVPGEGESSISIIVEDQSGAHQEYEENHQAGEPLSISVSFLGPGEATVYQNEQVIMTVELP